MGPLILLPVLLAAAPLQLTVPRHVGLAPAEVDGVALRLRSALSGAGLADAERLSGEAEARCGRDSTCLLAAVKEQEAHVLVEVELAWVAGQLGANLAATEAATGQPLTSHRFIVGGDERYQLALDAELVRFAGLLKASLPEGHLALKPTPSLSPAALEEGPPAVSALSHPAFKHGAIGGAAASGIAAAVFASLGFQAGGQLERSYVPHDGGGRTSKLDQQSAGALADTANARLTGALISSGLALGFAGVAVWLELRDEE